MKQLVRFNINNSVRVRLNDHGRAIHRAEWDDRARQHPQAFKTYRPPVEDADGFSSWQAWSLMQTFGPHISLGLMAPFDTVIELEVDL